jgi:cobalt-zinc-cadmium efflux system protein
MKGSRSILIAFILNLGFSLLELFGGLFTNSIAILSDSLHDLGDAASIGISYFLEKKSKKQPDDNYTYGYLRYSVMGSVITTVILLVGSVFVAVNAISRIIDPKEIDYDGMLIFAVIGFTVNLFAAFFTRNGESMNQKAVNLHMLEDVLGWAVVLVGAVIMRFTDVSIIDPILSLCVAVYIFVHALTHLKEALDLFLVKTPHGIDVNEIKRHLSELDGVDDVHHIHIWSMDGNLNYATMHIVTSKDPASIKNAVRKELYELGIHHATVETEHINEHCGERLCEVPTDTHSSHSHHSHHHHTH